MSRRKNKKPQFTQGQALALGELRRLTDTHPDSITVVSNAVRDEGGGLQIVVRLSTKNFTVADGGLPISGDYEDVTIRIPR